MRRWIINNTPKIFQPNHQLTTLYLLLVNNHWSQLSLLSFPSFGSLCFKAELNWFTWKWIKFLILVTCNKTSLNIKNTKSKKKKGYVLAFLITCSQLYKVRGLLVGLWTYKITFSQRALKITRKVLLNRNLK